MTKEDQITVTAIAAVAAADEDYDCILPVCERDEWRKHIPDEEIAAAVAVGASVIKHWSTVSGIAAVG